MNRASTQWPVNRFVRRGVHAQGLDANAFVAFGAGSTIVPPASVTGHDNIVVGDGVLVMEHARLSAAGHPGAPVPRLVLGDRVRLARFATVVAAVEVVIEEGVSTSDNVVVTDDWACGLRGHGTLAPPAARPTIVERGAYLGCNAIVLPGVRVGAGAFVGEGAVVANDVAPHAVVYGNPAVAVRRFDAAANAWIEERRA